MILLRLTGMGARNYTRPYAEPHKAIDTKDPLEKEAHTQPGAKVQDSLEHAFPQQDSPRVVTQTNTRLSDGPTMRKKIRDYELETAEKGRDDLSNIVLSLRSDNQISQMQFRSELESQRYVLQSTIDNLNRELHDNAMESQARLKDVQSTQEKLVQMTAERDVLLNRSDICQAKLHSKSMELDEMKAGRKDDVQAMMQMVGNYDRVKAE